MTNETETKANKYHIRLRRFGGVDRDVIGMIRMGDVGVCIIVVLALEDVGVIVIGVVIIGSGGGGRFLGEVDCRLTGEEGEDMDMDDLDAMMDG